MGKFTNKDEAVKALQGIESSEVYVFSEKEHNELLENYKKSHLDAFERNRITEMYNDIDKNFYKATGIKRPEGYGEKRTYEFWPEVAKDLKDKHESLRVEMEKLKSNQSPDAAKEIEALRKASIEKDNEWKAKFEKMQSELTAKDIKNVLDVSVRSFKLSNLPEPVLNTFIESAKNKLSQSAKYVEGQLVFTDADGNPRLNKETFKPYTAEELLAVELAPVIDKGKETPKGGGTQPPKIVIGKEGKPDITVIVPTTVRNKMELTRHLIEGVGLPLGTPEHEAAFAKYGVNLPIA